MDPILLGRRFREARLAKHMTQSEVVGTFITRNMLSQIESGNASPSIRTLEYLSEVLEIPLSELIDNTDNAEAEEHPYLNLKQLFMAEHYHEVCLSIKEYLQESHPFYDECCAMYSRSCLALGTQAYEKKDYRKAFDLAKDANQYAQLGCYASRDIKTKALLLMDSITEKM